MDPQTFREETQRIYLRAYGEHPGLEQFRRRKKTLLLLAMGLFALQRLLAAIALGGGWMLLAALGGLLIPGIFVMAVWRGGWKLSLVLLLPAANALVSLFTDWLPMLREGGYPTLFYVAFGVMVLLPVTLIGTTAWLSIPARNREYGDVLNGIHEELIQISKYISQKK